MYSVYCVTNKITNKKYIGITSRDPFIRFNEHCYQSKSRPNISLLSSDMKIYDIKNFDLEILESNIKEDLIDEKERYYIKRYNTLFPNGYNKSTGGIKGHDLNEISRKILSEKGSGINNSRCKNMILQYDLNRNLISKYGSAREAGRALGHESKYHSIINHLKSDHIYDGYIWEYEQ